MGSPWGAARLTGGKAIGVTYFVQFRVLRFDAAGVMKRKARNNPEKAVPRKSAQGEGRSRQGGRECRTCCGRCSGQRRRANRRWWAVRAFAQGWFAWAK